jgi:hypothetical protein
MMNAQVSANVAHVYELARTRTIVVEAINFEEPVYKADGVHKWIVPSALNGGEITGCEIGIATAGTAGTVIMQLARTRSGVTADVLSTRPVIEPTEYTSYTGTGGVVNATYKTLATGDLLRFDVDDHGGGTATANGGQQGLFAILTVVVN